MTNTIIIVVLFLSTGHAIAQIDAQVGTQASLPVVQVTFDSSHSMSPENEVKTGATVQSINDVSPFLSSPFMPRLVLNILAANSASDIDVGQQVKIANLPTDWQFNALLLWGTILAGMAGLAAVGLHLYVARQKSLILSDGLRQHLEHSPHPIIVLNQQNQLVHHNPAAKYLIAELPSNYSHIVNLLPKKLQQIQSELRKSDKNSSIFEYSLGNMTLECQLHWLPQPSLWHLHIKNITARKQAELKLQFQAYHHPETGLENQYRFKEVIESWVNTGDPFTLGLLEIRSFSQLLTDDAFNKSQYVVIELAAVLDKVCHDMDCNIRLFHIGDKNFAVLIPEPDCEETIVDLVSNVQGAMKAAQFSGSHHLELDFGFACFPQDGNSVDEMIRNTRIALDTSASQEHSDFLIFNDQLGEAIARQNKLHVAMREALASRQFQLYFQPQLSLDDNKIVGAEVLLRWQLQGQWISPDEFIPLAERSGFILQLGDWILTQACIKAREMMDMGFDEFVTAVNISPKQFTAPNFVAQVTDALNRSGLPAQNLELEITEGVLFNNDSSTLTSLQKLRQMGVKLAIDDFGTGYSSLSYLRDFPIDKLKIDQSFVRDMHTDDADQSIVRTVIDLGRNLRITLIAEGVEKQEQVDKLHSMGCHEIQGFWYSKPLDEGFFTYFLQQSRSIA